MVDPPFPLRPIRIDRVGLLGSRRDRKRTGFPVDQFLRVVLHAVDVFGVDVGRQRLDLFGIGIGRSRILIHEQPVAGILGDEGVAVDIVLAPSEIMDVFVTKPGENLAEGDGVGEIRHGAVFRIDDEAFRLVAPFRFADDFREATGRFRAHTDIIEGEVGMQ